MSDEIYCQAWIKGKRRRFTADKWTVFSKKHLHRLDGPAVEYADGLKEWWQNGQRHRTDGPALEYPDGHCEWYQNDKLHRVDGPAIEWGNKIRDWAINDQDLDQAQVETWIKENNIDLSTEEGQTAFVLKWS